MVIYKNTFCSNRKSKDNPSVKHIRCILPFFFVFQVLKDSKLKFSSKTPKFFPLAKPEFRNVKASQRLHYSLPQLTPTYHHAMQAVIISKSSLITR